MARKTIKIMACNTGYDDGDTEREVKNILKAQLNDVFKYAADHKIDLICLPAGYFRTKTKKEMEKLGEGIYQLAKKYKIGFVLGIDTTGKKKNKKKRGKKVKNKSGNTGLYLIYGNPKKIFMVTESNRAFPQPIRFWKTIFLKILF